jgi:hypothetical protein
VANPKNVSSANAELHSPTRPTSFSSMEKKQ